MQNITLQEKLDLQGVFRVIYEKKESKFAIFYKALLKKFFKNFKKWAPFGSILLCFPAANTDRVRSADASFLRCDRARYSLTQGLNECR